jgi:hypothetical protein
MLYGPTAVERAMRRQEVIMRMYSGGLTWLQAADILRMSPRSLQRLRRRYEQIGYDGRAFDASGVDVARDRD